MKIIKGDRVVVIAGKDKGAEGVVALAIPEAGKVVVEGINIAKKHQAPTRADQQGGIIEKPMPMDVSNVAVVSPKDGKATKVGYKINADGSKVRICRRTGEEIT
ncbi:MAG: 50S ribosomal protein L24 [Acidimicrobiales bacterium]|nr:50S ribosomal protein L24 [Acidimicrobiales bacterium]